MLTKAWWRKESSQPWQKTSAVDTEQFCRNGSIQGMFRCGICGHVLTWVPASNTAPAYFQHEDSSADALCESHLNTSLPSTEGYSHLTCRLSKGKKNFRMEIGLPPLSEQAFLQALSLRLQFRIADHKGAFERYNLSEEPFAPEKTIWLPLPEDFARARIYALPAHACPPQWQCQPDFSRDALLFDADSGLLHPSGDDIRPGNFLRAHASPPSESSRRHRKRENHKKSAWMDALSAYSQSLYRKCKVILQRNFFSQPP